MAHEQSETVETDGGRWENVYGRGPAKGLRLRLEPGVTYASEAEAVEAAKIRSAMMPPEAAPSPSLSDTSADLMGRTKPLLEQSSALTERRAGRLEAGAAESETEARAISDLARQQEAERAAARPAKPDLTKPPSTAARAFLEPGTSVLGQVQTIMQGIGQLAMGIAGTKGRGYAIAATAALKGAAEGWQAGDAERVKRSLAEWQTNHEHLMAQYQLERDQFNDLLTDQKLTMSERFAQMRMRAEILQMKDLADAARQEDITRTMNIYQAWDQSAIAHEKNAATFAMWIGRQGNVDRAYQALQEQRATTNQQRQEALNEQKKTRDMLLRKGELAELEPFKKAGRLADGLNELETIYSKLEREHPELAPKSGEVFDAWASRIQRALRPGDTSLFQLKMLWNQVIVGLLERGWSDEKGVRALAVFQSQLNVQDQMPPPEALHSTMKSIRGLVRKGIDRDLEARRRLGASPTELELAKMFSQTLHDPADAQLVDEMQDLFQ